MKHNFIKRLLIFSLVSIGLLGSLSTGTNASWKQDNVGWYYQDGNSYFTGWFKDTNGKWYYFYKNGYMAKNTMINGYYLGVDGAWDMHTNDGIIEDTNIMNASSPSIINNVTKNNNVNVEASKTINVKTIDDLEEYLNDNYSSLRTPIGTLKFSFNTIENDDKMFPYDFEIQTDWGDIEDSKYDLDDFDPSDLTNSIKISDDDKEKTKELLKEYQKNVAKVAMKYFPEKKIKGGFYSGFYKYQYLRTGYESVQFYSWKNYDLDLSSYNNYTNQYNYSTLSDFQWDNKYDTYNLD